MSSFSHIKVSLYKSNLRTLRTFFSIHLFSPLLKKKTNENQQKKNYLIRISKTNTKCLLQYANICLVTVVGDTLGIDLYTGLYCYLY